MTRMDFSVVVPFYNAEQFIERCVRALLEQAYPADRYEILMVDNGSTDSSASIVGKFGRVRLLKEPEQGSYAARNRGIREARGSIVAFTDPDCVPREDWLAQIGRAMDRPNTSVVLGDRQFAGDCGMLGDLAAYESALCRRIFETGKAEYYYAYTNNMAVRMTVLKATGGFERLPRGADTLFLRRVLRECGSSAVTHSPDVLVRHLEIGSARDYLRKKGIYGRINRNPELSPSRSLPLTTRCGLALQVVRARGGSLADKIAFLGVLVAGAIRFDWERRKD